MTISCSRLGRIEANRGERVPWGVICGHLSENTQKIGFNSNIAPSYSTRVSTYHVEHVVRSLHYPLTSLASRCAPRVTCHGAEAAHTLTGALLRSPRYLAPSAVPRPKLLQLSLRPSYNRLVLFSIFGIASPKI